MSTTKAWCCSLAIQFCCVCWIGCGNSNTTTQTCSTACTPSTPQFLYVGTPATYSLGPDSGALSTFSVDANGVPTLVATKTNFPTPTGIVVDPSGRYLFVPTYDVWGDIWAFSIDSTTGNLTGIPNSPFDTDLQFQIFNVAIDSTGQFLYLAASQAGIVEFKIDPSTQSVSYVVGGGGGPYNPFQVRIHPSGNFIYAVGNDFFGQREITAYTDSVPGVLGQVPNSPFLIPANFGGPLAFGAGGKYVYGGTDSGVWADSIDPGSGALTQISVLAATTSNLYDMATDPAGRFLFASNVIDNTISVFAIDANSGLLTPVAGSPFDTKSTPVTTLAVDPSGKFLYAASWNSGGISVFSIEPTSGALGLVAGSPFFSGQSFNCLAFRPAQTADQALIHVVER